MKSLSVESQGMGWSSRLSLTKCTVKQDPMSIPTGQTLPDMCSRETPTVSDSHMVRDTNEHTHTFVSHTRG